MSSDLQSLNSIAPIANTKNTLAGDPVRVAYEEGKKCLENDRYGEAAVSLHNALVGFEEKQDENGIANASNQLGHLCLVKKEYETALKHYQRAFEICDKHNDRMSLVAIIGKVVDVHREREDFDEAIEKSLEILDHYQDNRDPQGSVATLEKMADIYIAAGKNNKAADAYRTVASIHKNFKHNNIAKGFIEKADELER
jgi:tetratricopeptide (TPR) repeat protein